MNRSHRILRAALLGLGACLFYSPGGQAAETMVTYHTTAQVIDTWVKSGIAVSNDGQELSIGGGREIYLRIRVDAASVGPGMPRGATLYLKQKNGVSGVTIDVYAANNRKNPAGADWQETLVWTDRPLATTLLASMPARSVSEMNAGTNTILFFLDNYISGPGDYTFCVKTASATQVNFYSSETSYDNRPKLDVAIENGQDPLDDDSEYYWRLPNELKNIMGAEYRDRYKASTAGGAANNEVDNVGYFDVTRQPYGAKTDGTDATLAIQRAVNEARAARVAVYFPPGNYIISDTIQLVQGDNPFDHSIDGLRWSGREFPNVLLGNRNSALARSKLTLAASSPGFNTQGAPKPMLHFWSREAAPDPRVNKANNQYNQILDNIDLNLGGASNRWAIGIDMDAAQGSNISNSSITATNAFAGLYGGTGPGGYTYGVTVTGGDYGGRFLAAHCPLLINCKFASQAVNSLYHSGRGPLTLVGGEINGRGIKLESTVAGPWMANLNVVDSRIQVTGLAVESNRSVALTNVYLFNGVDNAPLVKVTDPVPMGTDTTYVLPNNHNGWKRVIQLARGVNMDQSIYQEVPTSTASRIKYWVDGNSSNTGWHKVEGTNGAPPTTPPNYSAGGADNLHAWVQTPDFNDPNVINAKTTGLVAAANRLKGDGSDDAPRLRAIIAAANGRPIFIPAGEYTLNSTVNLGTDTTLFGMGTAFTILRPKSDFAANTALLESPYEASATTMLADLKLLLPMNTTGSASLLKWQSGAGSTVKNVDFDRRLATANNQPLSKPVILITGDRAGGKWYGPRVFASSNFTTGARYLKVENTANQKLRIYMLNVEHCAYSPQAEFVNADNFDIYQLKAESYNYNGANSPVSAQETISFNQCTQFRVFGFGGSASPNTGLANANIRVSDNCNDFLLTQIQFQQQDPAGNPNNPDDGIGYYPATFRRLIWTGGPAGSQVLGDEQAVLYLKGTPPDQVN